MSGSGADLVGKWKWIRIQIRIRSGVVTREQAASIDEHMHAYDDVDVDDQSDDCLLRIR